MTTETRVKRILEFEPEGTDDGELPVSFRLIANDTPQRRHRTRGWVGAAPGKRTVLTEGITRRELEALIGDAASWLAWDGKDG
jgi:hypothetical protein